MRRRQRRRADAVDDALEREFQLMRLVQRDFEHARDHLRAAGQALRRRVDHGQRGGRDPAVARRPSRRPPAAAASRFRAPASRVGVVAIAEILEQRLLVRERARRAGAEREEARLARAVRQAPARVLAGRGRRSPAATSARKSSRASAASRNPARVARVPRPPRQISAMRRPASTPPRRAAPASISVSPSGPVDTPRPSGAASRISAWSVPPRAVDAQSPSRSWRSPTCCHRDNAARAGFHEIARRARVGGLRADCE